MNESEMLEAVRAKTETSYIIDGENGKHSQLIVARKNGRIVVEFDKDDSQRMAQVARVYGLKV